MHTYGVAKGQICNVEGWARSCRRVSSFGDDVGQETLTIIQQVDIAGQPFRDYGPTSHKSLKRAQKRTTLRSNLTKYVGKSPESLIFYLIWKASTRPLLKSEWAGNLIFFFINL